MSTKKYRQSIKGWAKIQMRRSRCRAAQMQLEFALTEQWLIDNLPDRCPILNIPIVVGCDRQDLDNAPSVDRVDNDLGYTPDNCRIISYRANRLKNSASRTELQAVLRYIDQHKLASVQLSHVDTHLL